MAETCDGLCVCVLLGGGGGGGEVESCNLGILAVPKNASVPHYQAV